MHQIKRTTFTLIPLIPPITLITLITLITFFTPLQGQIRLKGYIIDVETSEPVVAAYLIKPDGTGSYSQNGGYFEITVNSIPVKLKVKHVSYGEVEVNISYPVPDPLIIRIHKQISQIGEVQVTAERMRVLTEKVDFTLQDFAFDDNYLWMLGYLNNLATKGRLWQASWFGDTIRSIPVRGAEKIERDLFGNVQLFAKDSVFQIYGNSDTLFFAYAYPRHLYESTMDPILANFYNNLVYSSLSDNGFFRTIYYHSEAQPERMWLTSMWDSLGKRDMLLFRYTGGQGIAPKNTVIAAPMFSLNDSLYIVQVIKDSLLVYDPKGRFARSTPFGYHKVKVLGVPEYKTFEFLTDPIENTVYLLNHQFYTWHLIEVDPQTGETGIPKALPDYPGMTRITPFANAVYFLYTEKKYPYYTRLHRLQL